MSLMGSAYTKSERNFSREILSRMTTRNGSMMMGSSMYYRVCSTTLQDLGKPRNGSHSRGIADFATSIIHHTSFNGHLFPNSKTKFQKIFSKKIWRNPLFYLTWGLQYVIICIVTLKSQFPKILIMRCLHND